MDLLYRWELLVVNRMFLNMMILVGDWIVLIWYDCILSFVCMNGFDMY